MFNSLRAWYRRKRRATKVFFKKSEPFDIFHPDLADKVEVAFSTRNATYYRFKQDVEMPTGRFKWVNAFLYEVDLRMTVETAKGFLKELDDNLTGKRGNIDLIKCGMIVKKMISRLNMRFDVETVERLASVVYFTDEEILDTYSRRTGEEKIRDWQREGCIDFFWMRPVGELLKLQDTSMDSLQEYIKWQRETAALLIYEPQNPLSENS